uniref:PNPLA domain-containing protein n=1 Tax=Corethron hystrix TaxID=216773 RepID=A0A7S1BAF7_9STRA
MAAKLASVREKIWDLTLPLTSFFSGKRFNAGIRDSLGDDHIQDFVLSFFCVSVDISSSRQVVHTKGLAWKYVRASMSLSGYLPPVSENNSLLVDGGYMNVMPADVMTEQFKARTTIAVDVASEKEVEYYDYGTELSGLWLLWNSWNPFARTVKVPSMGDISQKLAWVNSQRHKESVVRSGVDLFLSPPVGEYGTLEFDKFDEIVQVGYDYAKPIVQKWARKRRHVAP